MLFNFRNEIAELSLQLPKDLANQKYRTLKPVAEDLISRYPEYYSRFNVQKLYLRSIFKHLKTQLSRWIILEE